jgi:hypothetical protein
MLTIAESMQASLPSQPTNMVTARSRRHPPAISLRDLADKALYMRLRTSLNDPRSRLSLPEIRIRLNNDRLTDANARKLFGSIRKSVLDAIWQHRNLEEWIWRCTRMGSDYAQATMQEGGAGTDAVLIDFYDEQDSYLEMSGGMREEVVEQILQHVGVYREAVQGVERLQGEKERMLEAERA